MCFYYFDVLTILGLMHGQGVMKGKEGEVLFEGVWEEGKSKIAKKDLPEVYIRFLLTLLMIDDYYSSFYI